MKIISIILFLGLLVACREFKKEKNKLTNTEPVVQLNILNDLINKNFDYSSLIDSIEVIKLETNPNSLFGDIRKIEFLNDKFYVIDDTQVLFIFDKTGNYLKKLNKKGKGPGEYLELRDFFVEKDGSIKILSYNTILTFDSNLNFIEKKAIKVRSQTDREINPVKFLPNGEFTFLYPGSFGLRNLEPGKENSLYCINNKNQIENEYFPIFSMETMGHKKFYISNGLVNFTHTYGNDTIYQVHDRYLSPKVYVNFGENRISEKDMMRNHASVYNTICEKELCGLITRVYENNHYLCFRFVKGKYPKQAVYNKKTKEIKVINVVKSLPFPKIMIEGLIDDSFFTTIDPQILLQMTDNNNKNFLYNFNLSNLKETDNTIIIKFKFKF